ncbi:response regulator [Gracilibacillus marinus]|uniref:Response regulator n=1 Tax=Gracilibacillus marinus TaxID=630535 RepID=A0ABV8VSF7_9BACI
MRAILIDDEPLAIDYLAHQLTKIHTYDIVAKFSNPFEAQEKVSDYHADVLFLDIEMPGINGMELAEILLDENPKLHIVFVTAYNQYAVTAFELNAMDYLLKPATAERLKKTTKRLMERISLNQLSEEETPSQYLFIQLFHTPLVFDGNKTIELKWRTSKAKQLFFYLLHHRDRLVTKDELVEQLWPDFSLEKSYTQLYTTIYHVRSTLKQYVKYIQIKNSKNGYSLVLRDVEIDVDLFERFIREDKEINEQTIQKYEEIMAYCKGEYMFNLDYAWANNEYIRLQYLWVQTKKKMIGWYTKNKAYEKATEHALEIYKRYPLEEEGYFELMKIFAITGKSTLVQKCFEELKEMLEKELELQPSVVVMDWYEEWLESIEV